MNIMFSMLANHQIRLNATHKWADSLVIEGGHLISLRFLLASYWLVYTHFLASEGELFMFMLLHFILVMKSCYLTTYSHSVS